MRIAILADPLDNQRAGVHVYTREMIRALIEQAKGHELILIREREDPDLPIRQVCVPNVHLPIGFASLRLFFLIPIVVRRLGVDAVLEPAHFGPFNLPRRIRRITMIHDLTPILLPQYHRFHSQLLQRIFLKGILQKADLVLSNSHNTSSDLQKVYPFTEGKTCTIHLGRDESYQPTSSREFLDKEGIKEPYFLYVGTIEPRKNLSSLLKAYTAFRQANHSTVKLILTGQRGWKSEAFFQQLEQHPFRKDILLTGFIEKRFLPELYSHSLALVYPSTYEGFGFPIVEAFSCGTNVICPDNSSLTEVGGLLAYFYPTGEVDRLQAHMQTVYAGGPEVTRRREEALSWVQQFSWKTYAQRLLTALEELIN